MSDFDAQRLQRLKQLEDKRKRLEEMKKIRAGGTTTTNDVASEPSAPEVKEDVDELVKSLLKSNISESVEETKSNPEPVSTTSKSESTFPRKQKNLTFVNHVVSLSWMPTPKPETYDKEVMTDANEYLGEYDDDVQLSTPLAGRTNRRYQGRQPSGKNLIRSPSSYADNDGLNDDIRPTSLDARLAVSANIAKTERLAIDFNEISQKSEFVEFVTGSSRVIERALASNSMVDILKDYRSEGGKRRSIKDTFLTLRLTFDHALVKGRPVLDIRTSTVYPELLLVAYGPKPSTQSSGKAITFDDLESSGAVNAPGIVVVWSKITPSRPEFTFQSSSPVQTIRFLDDDPHLVIGGCYSGQLLLWDMRSKALPIHRSSLAGKGHKYPIFAMIITSSSSTAGSQGTANTTTEMFSCSVDGLCCQWDVSRLSDPIEVFPAVPYNVPNTSLGLPVSTLSHSNISAIGFGFDDSAGKYAIYGTGSGHLFRQPFPYRGSDANTSNTAIEGHLGLVTAIDLHPSSRQLYRNLVLTSSFDWTVKLWNFAVSPQHLLATFQSPSYDYVSDVKWNPVNPVVFAATTSGGDILIYNLSRSITEHVGKIAISQLVGNVSTSQSISGSSLSGSLPGALNRMLWSLDGKNLFVGDSKGSVYALDAEESITDVAAGDETKFEYLMLNLKSISP